MTLTLAVFAVTGIAATLEIRYRKGDPMWPFKNAQPKWGREMEARLTTVIGNVMTAVQVDDQDLANFASTIETEVGNLTTAVNQISSATTVLASYIQTLIAGQAVALPEGDETAIKQSITDLTAGASALGAAVGNLDALEPPAPTPGS